MGQLFKKTLILNDIKNKRQVYGIVKVYKNSIFKLYFDLKDANIFKDLTAAVISSNMPIQFIQFKTNKFDISLSEETEIENLVVIILDTQNYPLAASDCEELLLLGYLDTIKNLKKQFKDNFSFNSKFKDRPAETVSEKEPLKEPIQILKDILEEPKIYLTNNKAETKLEETCEEEINSESQSHSDNEFEEINDGLETDKVYIDNDILLREDSTLNDELEIAGENYYEENVLNNFKPVKQFYETIKSELNELFNKHEREAVLEKLIPQSKFCKIMYEEDKYYIVGLIFEDKVPQFICYGVPSFNPNVPPKELKGFSGFIPTNPDNMAELGYWIMYQDADTGETVYPKDE